MSRSQQGQTFKTSQQENQGYNANAATSYDNAQQDEGNFESQLGKYAAANPYVTGGQFQTTTNQQLANTADAGAQAAGQAIQGAAVRTGQNPAGAIAATEAMQQDNTRKLGAGEAQATADRLAAGAGYNQNVTTLSEQPASFEAQLSGMEGGLANGALGTQEQASQQPSFLDELGNGLINGAAGAGAAYAGKGCWIAAELYGGWHDRRTILLREWIFGPFAERWYGAPLAKAYLRFGERLAGSVRRFRLVRGLMRVVFDAALRRAETAERKEVAGGGL